MTLRTSAQPRVIITLSALIMAGLLLLLAACTGGGTGTPSGAPSPTEPDRASAPPPDQRDRGAPPDLSRAEPSRVPRDTTTVRLSFGGDVMFEDELRTLLDDPATGLAPIAAAAGAADFTMINLEAALTSRGDRDPKDLERADNRYHFRTGPAALSALRAAGVDAVSVANNHGVDFGRDGLTDTLRAKSAGTLPVLGVGRNRDEAFTPHRVTLRGQPFAFFAADASFLESSEPYWQAGRSSPGLAAARGPGRSRLLAAVRRAAADGATAVVYLHWGKENSAKVTGDQKVLARDLSRAGAAIVVGTHTHRLQGSGWLGTTYVSYGLGNFIWYHGSRGETGLLDLAVRNGRVVADGWRPALIPPEGGLPSFLDGTSAARARTAWRKLRQDSGLTAAPVEPAAFSASVSAITDPLRRRMSSSYRSGCPVPLRQLRHLRLSHWDFEGRARQGELVVAAKHVDAVVEVFAELFAAEFPIERMQLVSDFGGDDERSMAANNTSAFNCRPVAGTDRWSQHSYGAAIDLNPVQNPYVTGSGVSPRAGAPWAPPRARKSTVPGLITADSVAVRAFRGVGWEWGGDWADPRDYQHFSAEGS